MNKIHEQKKQERYTFYRKENSWFYIEALLTKTPKRGTITTCWWHIQQVLIMLSVHPHFINILRCPVTYCIISTFFFFWTWIQAFKWLLYLCLQRIIETLEVIPKLSPCCLFYIASSKTNRIEQMSTTTLRTNIN